MLLAATKTTSHGLPPELILLYVIVIGAVYYFYLRPRNKRMKAQRLETSKVDVGERAQTIGGLVGTVVKNQDGLVTIRTDGGVELQFISRAIAGKYTPPSPSAPPAPSIPESTDDHLSPDDHPTEGDAK
jgi:preprotein translocase subunit YajC